MGHDQNERRRQRKEDKPKRTVSPFFALEHRIVDSDAYADLGFTARNLIDLIGRQLTKDNNGHLQATFSWCQRYGIGSEHTLRNAIAELISHGFIYRTRSHGANGAWARYALTWLPIKKTDGLFLDCFRPNAWREWEPSMKNSSRQKALDQSSRKCSFTPELPAESAGKPTAESADYESCCHGSRSASSTGNENEEGFPTAAKRLSTRPSVQPVRHNWITAYLADLSARGHTGRQCFQIPQGATLQ